MKAQILYDTNVNKLGEIEESTCGPDHVRVKVMAAGICGSDSHKMQTKWKYQLPAVMGHEFTGEVVEIGENVTNVQLGERVVGIPFLPCDKCDYCEQGLYSLCDDYQMIGTHYHGAFAENTVLPAKNVLSIGDLDYDQAALIEPLSVALHGVIGIKPQIGDTVIVFGCGAIGMLTIQVLLNTGVKAIIAVDIDDEKLQQAKEYGCKYTINSIKENLVEKVNEYTNNRGVEIALECAGSIITQEQCLRVTAKKGKIGLLGIAYKDITLPQESWERIFRRELTLTGFWNSYSAPFPGREWSSAIDMIRDGRVDVKSMISHRYKLSELQDAYDMIASRKEKYNKVIIKPQEV